MGNAPDRTVDSILMNQHLILHEQFKKQEPLFHVEDIKFPLSTQGMKIVDATGKRVKLAGGNWSGAHMCRHSVDGLQCRPLKDIAQHIRYQFKMNCVRLTYSLQLFYDNNVIPDKYLLRNPDLQGKSCVQIFDITVKTLTDVGLMVILNNHTSTSQWCCSNDDGDGLWWSRQYPEYQYFQITQQLAKKYANNERVIGIDLRNELRKAHGTNPTWGDNNPRTDWKRAAKISGELALKHAPHWLVFVSGLNYQLDLSFVKQSPIEFSVPNKLCYTGHFYGFSWPIPSWSVYPYQSFKKKLFNSQTYVRSLGFPYLLGQFGNNQQDIPWKYLMQYLRQTDIDWTYWALDGFKCDREKDETYGVFTNDFSKARHPEMLQDMIKVGCPSGALARYPEIRKKNLGQKSLEVQQQFQQMKLQSKPQLPNQGMMFSNVPPKSGYDNTQEQSHKSYYEAFQQQGMQWGTPLNIQKQQQGSNIPNQQNNMPYQQPNNQMNYYQSYQQQPNQQSNYQQTQLGSNQPPNQQQFGWQGPNQQMSNQQFQQHQQNWGKPVNQMNSSQQGSEKKKLTPQQQMQKIYGP